MYIECEIYSEAVEITSKIGTSAIGKMTRTHEDISIFVTHMSLGYRAFLTFFANTSMIKCDQTLKIDADALLQVSRGHG